MSIGESFTFPIDDCWYVSSSFSGALDLSDVSVSQSFVDCSACSASLHPAPTSSATLAWSFSELAGGNGFMDIYINGFAVESRSSTSSGTIIVYVGDDIYVDINCDQCFGGGNTYANAYCDGIINEADCSNTTNAFLSTTTYTVVSGDIGTTLNLNTFAICDSACI
jgi:hypothetical protein